MPHYQSSPSDPQETELDIEDGPSIIVGPLRGGPQDFVLVTFQEGNPDDETFNSGQWLLTIADAHRIAVALYQATTKGVD